jgi:uncharacterized membrane-anchored protein
MKLKLLAAVIALQLAWIAGTVAVQETRLHSGVLVMLETALVDPRDLLRGDYLTLRYKIGSIPRPMVEGLGTNLPPAGTPVYVKLSPQGSFHVVAGASMSPLDPEPGRPVLAGRLTGNSVWWARDGTNSVSVEYGLERYFVREGTGNPRGTLTVQVSVPPSGRGIIREVFLDGRPYRSVMRDVGR